MAASASAAAAPAGSPATPARWPGLARRALRPAGRAAAAVLALALLALAGVYAASERRMRARFAVPAHAFAVPNDAVLAARGRRLAARDGCLDCHGAGLAGRVLLDEPPVARLVTPNLTRGGRGAALADADWERAVRHGVRRDGTPLVFMPAHELNGMPDDELAAVVAYARSLPAATTALPTTRVGPLGRALFLAGRIALVPAERVDHARPHAAHRDAEPTARYGATLAAGCMGCHGPAFAGGPIAGAPPGWPAATNLTPAGPLGRWTAPDFTRALRAGRRPDGTPVRPPMPLGATRALTDVELAALWAYLRALPPRPTGAR